MYPPGRRRGREKRGLAPSADYAAHRVVREDRPDGAVVLRSGRELGPVARTTLDWLRRWAAEAPGRVFIGERSGGGWREVAYRETAQMVRAAAEELLARGIGPGRSVVVLSGPSIEHAVLTLGAQTVGAVVVPLAEQYSLIPEARSRLRFCAAKVRPAMVYAADAEAYGPALALDVFDGACKVAGRGAGGAAAPFSDLLKGDAAADVDAAFAAVGPDTLAKILFTSGSTSDPKGVPQTQRMLTVNQAQYLACLPLLGRRAHRLLSWAPWNHVFGGNSDFNMMLSNGGSLYLDDGKPAGKLFARLLENLRMRPGTLSFNLPVAHALTVQAMRTDAGLRRAYFDDLDLFFYAGASLPSDVWCGIEAMAAEERGAAPMMITGWGMTETAPCAILYHEPGGAAGMVGVPVPELEAKLIPRGDGRYELRVRGPNVIDGYFEDPERTAGSFDGEGYFLTGDALRFADPGDDARGVLFDGRLTEDFKLTTGTWVRASVLRVETPAALSTLVRDIVVVGEGRDEIGLLVFPPPERLPAGPAADAGGAWPDEAYTAQLRAVLGRLAAEATGSSMRIARAIVLAEPPSVADGEITPKGSLNVRAVVSRRTDIVARLYDDGDPAVIRLTGAERRGV